MFDVPSRMLLREKDKNGSNSVPLPMSLRSKRKFYCELNKETCDVIQNRHQDNRHKCQLEVNIEVRSIISANLKQSCVSVVYGLTEHIWYFSSVTWREIRSKA